MVQCAEFVGDDVHPAEAVVIVPDLRALYKLPSQPHSQCAHHIELDET